MKTRKLKRSKFFWYFASVLFAAAGFYPASQASDFPDLITSLNMLEQTPQFCGERVPLQSQEVRERFEKEFLLILWNRPQVILWLKRTGRFFP
jgi:membrane-bound lytic murein transglycosylase D